MLLRVAVEVTAHGPRIVPDPRRLAPGRGAYVHRDPQCLERAVTRQALPRALRVPGAVISDALHASCVLAAEPQAPASTP